MTDFFCLIILYPDSPWENALDIPKSKILELSDYLALSLKFVLGRSDSWMHFLLHVFCAAFSPRT